MNREQIITKAEKYVKQELGKDASGHDWWHSDRVRKLAVRIAKEERADLFICELAALLHDVADAKLNLSEEVGLQKVDDWLMKQEVLPDVQKQVMGIIKNISFKAGRNRNKVLTLEGKVVQDADRLDAIGAIGIARTMAYAGSRGHLIHVPGTSIRTEMSVEEYRNYESTAIAHFYEKLLLLKNLMNTATGKRMAARRHAYMEDFLTEFYSEWDGKS
ncbi:HD domain-containing protein [Streptococcus hyovaginalis]|uniref:HD domain-containing protein n=1 Tax=Streptococcus hyovaginalis TaxID=149015 RepID=UPI003ADD3725